MSKTAADKVCAARAKGTQSMIPRNQDNEAFSLQVKWCLGNRLLQVWVPMVRNISIDVGVMLLLTSCHHHYVMIQRRPHISWISWPSKTLSFRERLRVRSLRLNYSNFSGSLSATGTDHCTFNANQKALGKDDFRKVSIDWRGRILTIEVVALRFRTVSMEWKIA